MKKVFVIAVILIVIGVIVYFLFIRRTPYSVANHIAGFKVPTSLKVEKYQDDWANNPGGDGETLIVFSFTENEKNELLEESRNADYKELPIEEALPDNYIYSFIDKENQSGFYRLIANSKDERNYKISVLDLNQNRLILYNVIY